MEITKTNKGGKKLLYEGYAYVVDKRKEDRIYWRCEKRGYCGGRITTSNDTVLSFASHAHQPDNLRCEVLKIQNKIKDTASVTEDIPSNIIHNATANISLDVCGALPKKESIARTVRRQRNVNEDEDLTTTTRGETFLLQDSEDIRIYSTSNNLRMLETCSTWLCDGTFDSPPVGKQLYTIHALVTNNKTLPMVYCLTSKKDEQTYERIFNFLKERNLNPTSISVDFERAVINSIKKIYPDTIVYGCFFHFGQCLWRKIQSLGLQSWYNETSNAFIIKQFQALAFVPPDYIYAFFEELLSSLTEEIESALDEFLAYFEVTWLGVVQRGRRRKPCYDIQLWSVHSRVADDMPRTNNALEGWHNAFNRRMVIKHASLEKLVSKLKKEQANTEMLLAQLTNGREIGRKNLKYVRINERLKNLVTNFHPDQGIQFLRAVAHNL